MTEQNKPVIWRVIVQMVIVVVIAPFIPMIISGQWDWWQAWAYAVASILAFVISRLIVARKHPDLIAERARFMEAKDTKSWDKILAPLLGLGSILILVVAGLDKYYAWSPASNPDREPDCADRHYPRLWLFLLGADRESILLRHSPHPNRARTSCRLHGTVSHCPSSGLCGRSVWLCIHSSFTGFALGMDSRHFAGCRHGHPHRVGR